MIRVNLSETVAHLPPVIVEVPELMNPLTGEIIDRESIDDLIDHLESLTDLSKRMYAVQCEIRTLLEAKCEGDAVTRRVQGKHRRAKIVLPDESFEQSVLKELWNSHHDLAQQYLKIGTLNVQMKEFNKLRKTSTDQAALQFFRDAMTAASKGRSGLPTVTVEV